MVYYWARTMPLRPAIIGEGIIPYSGLAHAVRSAAKYFAGNIVVDPSP